MNKANLDIMLENIEGVVSYNLYGLEATYLETSHIYEVDNLGFKKESFSDVEYIDF